MKTLIAKTVFLTTVFFVSIVVFVATLFAFTMPLKSADFFGRLGLENLSLSCYNHAYKNSSSINEISFMFDYAVKQKNHELVKKYGSKLLEHSEFNTFVSEKNALYAMMPSVELFNETNYIINSVVIAKLNTKRPTEAKQIAMFNLENSSPDEYFVFALSPLIEKNIKFTVPEIRKIQEKYELLKTAPETTAFAKKVIRLRLCETAIMLYKLTGEEKFSTEAAEFLK